MKLEIKNVTMKFGKKVALNNISTTFNSGSLIGLIGPNGAGKSTLFKILTTLLKPTGGQIFFNEQDVLKKPKLIQTTMAYLPQHVPYVGNLSLTEYLNYVAGLKGIRKNEARRQIPFLVKKFNLSNIDHKRKLNDFSGGMRQRAALCASLLGNPQIIVVDEPTAGLDPEERINLRNILSEMAKDKIVIMSTHIISDIEAVADHLLVLNNGHLEYDGSASELIKQADGHVWQMKLPLDTHPADLEKIGKVSSLVQSTHGLIVRIISANQPNLNAQLVMPHLEDAYLFLQEKG